MTDYLALIRDIERPSIAQLEERRQMRNYRLPSHTSEVAWTPNRLLTTLFESVPSDYGLLTMTGKTKLEEEKGLQVFEQMSRDTQCSAALAVKAAAVKVARWQVIPYDDSTEAKQQADFLTEAYTRLLGRRGVGFSPMLTAYDYGRADAEMTFVAETMGQWAGKYFPRKMKGKNPGFVNYEMDDFANMSGIFVKNLSGQVRNLDPRLMLHYTWNGQFENPYGRSDLLTCYPWWWAKQTLYKYLMIFADKYASPIPVVTMGKQLNPEDEKKLDAALKEYHISNYLKIPKGLELEMFQNNGTAGNVYILGIRECDSQSARGIFSNTLTIGENNKTGTHAQAKVHQGTLKDILHANLLDLEEHVAHCQITKRLVDVNFPAPKGYCRFQFWDLDSDELLAMAEAIDLLVNQVDECGNRTVNMTEDWIRFALNVPERNLDQFPIKKALAPWAQPPAPAKPGNKPMPNPTRRTRPAAAEYIEAELDEEIDSDLNMEIE